MKVADVTRGPHAGCNHLSVGFSRIRDSRHILGLRWCVGRRRQFWVSDWLLNRYKRRLAHDRYCQWCAQFYAIRYGGQNGHT